jgi:hypothetical protein
MVDRYILYHSEARVTVARDFFDARNKSYPGSFDYRVNGRKKARGYVRKLTGAHAHEGGNALTMSKKEDEANERTPLLSDPRASEL